ncbi:MAG: alpha-galactosidase [Clostridia bacterium]|nr:alpha-galactosidase [Clostridia bacterium]
MHSPVNYSCVIRTANDRFESSGEIEYAPLPGGGRSSTLFVSETVDDVIESAELTIKLRAADAMIFMNGFQTWTYCPEYTARDRIRGLHGLPKAIVNAWSLDRYGDYHFVDYPNKKGILHGESYCYFRTGEKFLLIGSVSEQYGYTLFRYDANTETLTVRRDCEGLRVNGSFPAFRLFIAEGGEDEVFDAWFAAMAVKPITTVRIAGYSSWYNRYEDITEKSIHEDLIGCAKVMKSGDLFQIDDGWEPAVGDWLEPDKIKFPNGMKAAADAIHEKGYKAGLWLAPFVAKKDSALVKDHPDWLLLHNGEPWLNGSNWGGFYSLDIDKPEVVQYVEQVFSRVFDTWGFDLVKLDFLYGAAPFGTGNETRAGRMIRAMKLLRRVCGEHPILGCGVPVMPAFGLVEYCRVSCDVGLDWDDKPWMRLTHRERVSTRQAMGNSVFRRQLNGRAYLSDPDVFFLREDNIKLTAEEKQKLSTLNAIIGGVLLTSDNMGNYGPEQLSRYGELLALRDAKVTGVEVAGREITVSYELNGKTNKFSFK